MWPETQLPDSQALEAKGFEMAVLVSVGRHPLTGRARRADQDARGLEMALALSGRLPGARIGLLHAGRRDAESEAALRGYLGMGTDGSPGLERVQLLEQPEGADVIPALAERLAASPPRLVIAGARAERGEGSGLLPYALAERLGWPLIGGLASVEKVESDTITVLQALPRGQRRRLKVRLPAIVTVDGAAPVARQSAFGPARRGDIDAAQAAVVMDGELAEWSLAPARKRPKRLKIVKAASARDRFKAAAAKAEGGGQVLEGVTAEQGAEAIFKLLEEEGVLR